MPSTKQLKKPKATKINNDITYPVVVTKEEANSAFLKRIAKHNTLEGSDTQKFLHVMRNLLEIKPEGFTLRDVFYFAEAMPLEREKIYELWEHYRTVMISMGKLAEVETCLDEQMFVKVR